MDEDIVKDMLLNFLTVMVAGDVSYIRMRKHAYHSDAFRYLLRWQYKHYASILVLYIPKIIRSFTFNDGISVAYVTNKLAENGRLLGMVSGLKCLR